MVSWPSYVPLIKTMIANKNKKGFTLIETLIYIALLTIMIGGSLAVSYQILSGNTRDDSAITIQKEANFVIRKIEMTLNGAKPNEVTTGSSLSIDSSSDYCFTLNGNKLSIKNEICGGGGTLIPITSTSVTVSSFDSSKNNSSINISFTINGKNFQSEIFLR